jgi:UPF0716 protein FxsA
MPVSHKRDAMPLFLILLFPLAEIATFIFVGGVIGVTRTLALVIVSSAVGLVMLRDAGAVTALKLQRQTANPGAILAEGGTRMLAGLLLLIPGFLTDIAAGLVLIPAVRRLVLARVGKKSQPSAQRTGGPEPKTIEGDFRRVDLEQ